MSVCAEEEAARWALRHPLTDREQAECDRWVGRDPRYAGLLLRAMAGLSTIDHALLPDRQTLPLRPARRHLLLGAGGAIAAAVAGLVGWSHLTGERVTTRRGEIRRLPLVDGSVATINTDSELRVAFGGTNRRIELSRGQAWFQVAKDRRRPFVVDAGLAHARAIGTAFSVDREGDGVRVSVTEGVVAVWPNGAPGTETILTAGQFATFNGRTPAPRVGTAPHAIERALAWRNGEISLENETLGNAVTQFNRYNRQQIVVGDAALAGEQLVGLFQIDKPGDFAATLAASHDVAVSVTPDRILIDRKKTPRD